MVRGSAEPWAEMLPGSSLLQRPQKWRGLRVSSGGHQVIQNQLSPSLPDPWSYHCPPGLQETERAEERGTVFKQGLCPSAPSSLAGEGSAKGRAPSRRRHWRKEKELPGALRAGNQLVRLCLGETDSQCPVPGFLTAVTQAGHTRHHPCASTACRFPSLLLF